MALVYKLSLVTIFILCTIYNSRVMAGCSYGCGLVCGLWGCRVSCGLRCSWGKRSEIEYPRNTKQVPFPDKFEKYDLDKNGGITLEELAKALKVEELARETVIAFKLADKDDDQQIDCNEFKAAPFLFAHKPICPTV